jgi:hypothetical protein
MYPPPPPRLCLKMTQLFRAIGILPNPPFFPFVLKQRCRTGESLQCLPSAGASDSHCAFASCCAPFFCAPLVVHSGWLSCRLLSCRCLSYACAAASHCTTTSHCAPLAPLVRLDVVSPLITLPSPVRLRLRLSLHRQLLLHPSYTSCLAGCCVTSCHAATSRPPAPPPLIAPLSRLLTGWL